MSAISVSELTKVYSTGVTALDQLTLDVASGEFVVLVGPSGCGKTTALRMVAGLETITSGEIRFGDRMVNGVSPRQRDVAMVFQNYALYPHLTVAENIGFALRNKGLSRAETAAKVASTAAVLGLSDLLNRRPARLSGGQRQRVAMGRAIVRSPSVFLMDEPLSNLDAKLRVQMRAEVLRVHREIGVATLYVTHDQVEAMTMGDRVAVLHDGVLQQYDTPRALYSSPANLFVAEFIGSPEMNLYEASLSSSGIVLGSQQISLPTAPPALAAYSGRKVIVGFRPEDLTSGSEGDLVADVHVVEALGSESHVFFAIDAPSASGGALAAVTGEAEGLLSDDGTHNGVARVDPRFGVRSGERVTFAVDTSRLHFFDPDTGNAIR
jgi:multiple sugar transport system ATP-binding protein